MLIDGAIKTSFITSVLHTSVLHHICPSLHKNLSIVYLPIHPGGNTSLTEQAYPSSHHCSACFFATATPFYSPLHPHLAVRLGLLPLHLAELGLEGFVLIGQHLETVLEAGTLLLVATNQLAVDLVLRRIRVQEGIWVSISTDQSKDKSILPLYQDGEIKQKLVTTM